MSAIVDRFGKPLAISRPVGRTAADAMGAAVSQAQAQAAQQTADDAMNMLRQNLAQLAVKLGELARMDTAAIRKQGRNVHPGRVRNAAFVAADLVAFLANMLTVETDGVVFALRTSMYGVPVGGSDGATERRSDEGEAQAVETDRAVMAAEDGA